MLWPALLCRRDPFRSGDKAMNDLITLLTERKVPVIVLDAGSPVGENAESIVALCRSRINDSGVGERLAWNTSVCLRRNS